jgi:hypothetical protein
LPFYARIDLAAAAMRCRSFAGNARQRAPSVASLFRAIVSLFRAGLSLLFWNRKNAFYPSVSEQKNLQQNTPKPPKK